MANAAGRLAEAYTCTGSCTSKVTDLGFSYSARGEVNNALELTPHSGGYYNVSESYWPNGAPSSISGIGLPMLSYGVDGEGRLSTMGASSGPDPVTGTTYSPGYGLATQVSLGSGDSDNFG